MKKKFFGEISLIIAMLLTLFMASTDAPASMGIFAVFILLWKWGAERKGWPVFPRKLTGALSLLLPIQVYFQYKTLLGQEASSTLLLGLAALKIMDYENERDHKFLILLGFLMVSLKPVFSLDLYWLPPSLIAFMCLWYALLVEKTRASFRYMSKVFLYSLPLTLLLFFAFPRFVLPWAMSRSTSVPVVGFSDQLNPGEVAELASNDSLAFRVKFQNSKFKIEDLYWRGSVLAYSDGLRWLPSRSRMDTRVDAVPEKTLSYDVILEPGANNYLFVINKALQVTATGLFVAKHEHSVFRVVNRSSKTINYHAVSDLRAIDTETPEKEFSQTPKLSSMVQTWVDGVKTTTESPSGRLEKLKEFFSDSRFVYTLKPGRYDKNDLENFLFVRRRGFCEHYAGAYATLARALGIPSRVVIGYQGGIYNPVGDFWKITQKDAHAWAEVFYDQAWHQVDPTSWIAPLRFTLGADTFFSLTEEQQEQFAKSTEWKSSPQAWPWLDAVTYRLDDINYQWTYFLMDFDRSSQKDLWLRISDNFRYLFWVLALAAGMLILTNFWRSSQRASEIENLFLFVQRWASKKGIAKESSEPPWSFLKRLQQEFPDQKNILEKTADVYDQKVYQDQDSAEAIRTLFKEWRKAR